MKKIKLQVKNRKRKRKKIKTITYRTRNEVKRKHSSGLLIKSANNFLYYVFLDKNRKPEKKRQIKRETKEQYKWYRKR